MARPSFVGLSWRGKGRERRVLAIVLACIALTQHAHAHPHASCLRVLCALVLFVHSARIHLIERSSPRASRDCSAARARGPNSGVPFRPSLRHSGFRAGVRPTSTVVALCASHKRRLTHSQCSDSTEAFMCFSFERCFSVSLLLPLLGGTDLVPERSVGVSIPHAPHASPFRDCAEVLATCGPRFESRDPPPLHHHLSCSAIADLVYANAYIEKLYTTSPSANTPSLTLYRMQNTCRTSSPFAIARSHDPAAWRHGCGWSCDTLYKRDL